MKEDKDYEDAAKNIFINGEIYTVGPSASQLLEKLADQLALPMTEEFDEEVLTLLYEWYLAGYVDLSPSGSGKF